MGRNLLNDEKTLRQVAEFRLGHNHHFIRVCFEGSRHFASVTHCQKSNAWCEDLKEQHLQAFFGGQVSNCLKSLWPLCLGSTMMSQRIASEEKLVYSILCTPLDSDRFRWLPTQDFQSGANVDLTSASTAKLRNNQLAIQTLTSVASSIALSRGLLSWLLSETMTLDTVQVSLALRGVSPEALNSAAVVTALSLHREGPLLLRMLNIACGELSFTRACRGSDFRQFLQLSRFWLYLFRKRTTASFSRQGREFVDA